MHPTLLHLPRPAGTCWSLLEAPKLAGTCSDLLEPAGTCQEPAEPAGPVTRDMSLLRLFILCCKWLHVGHGHFATEADKRAAVLNGARVVMARSNGLDGTEVCRSISLPRRIVAKG